VARLRKNLRPFYAALGEHRRQLDRLANKRALPRMKRLYDEAHDAVARRLHNLMHAGRGETFTAHQQRIVLAQLKVGQRELAGRLAGELSDVTREAQTDAIRGLSRSISKLERHFTGAEVSLPIDEAWRLRELVGRRRPMLDDMHQRSMARWGARLFSDVHEATSMALAQDLTTEEAIRIIPEAAAAEWWQGERIVRTETAWAYNLGHADGIDEATEVLPDLMKRWTEHVDDSTGQPLDDRVAPDSLAMHGQVTEADGEFGFPSDAEGMTEKEISRMQERGPWVAPPNRPNDRASLQPWRPGWGIPAWQLVGGRRVWM
jgi:hypothetical protein